MPVARHDDAIYRDDGCDLAPKCLECPFERCRYDEPVRPRHTVNLARNADILRRLEAGETVQEIAKHYGVTTRAVFRVRQAARLAVEA